MRTYAKTTRRLDGKDRTGTVTVEACAGTVLVSCRDEGSDRDHLDRRSSADPRREALRIGADLERDGYTLIAG